MTEPARTLLACVAAMLDQGQTVDRLSRSLTAAALIGLLVHPAAIGPPPWELAGVVILIALAGLVEAYFAIRVGFDAALFHQVANAPGAPDFADTDQALTQLRLLPATKLGRPVGARIAGARRLLRFQVLALLVQVLAVVGGGVALTWR